jgi:chromate reductase
MSFYREDFMKKMHFFCCLLAIVATVTLTAEIKVLAFAGSTRADSYNQQLVQEAANMARHMGAKVTVIHLNDYPMPFYDADLETKEGMPKNAQRLRKLMIESDAIIIASPEYNRSVSGVLKNALDWASRGEDGGSSSEACEGKIFAIMSASPGKKGGSRGLAHLQNIIEDIGGTVVQQLVTVPHAHKYFSEKERLENPLLRKALQELLSIKNHTL